MDFVLVSFKMYKDELLRAARFAKKHRITMSELYRKAIRSYINGTKEVFIKPR